MEELTLNKMQIYMLKTMIEAYEKGIDVSVRIGIASGKTTVMKIFNEYVRHKKENPGYKVSFTESGVNITFDTINVPNTDLDGTLRYKSIIDFGKIESEETYDSNPK